MTGRAKVLVGLAIAWFCGMAVVSAIVVPSNWAARNVPAHLRADRWELTPDGQLARSRAERLCGEFGNETWIDAPAGATELVLHGGTPEQKACFDEKIAPAFARAPVEL